MSTQYGYIFDFDGVLVNTMEAHFSYYGRALAEFGVPIERATFYRHAGMTGREQIAYFCRQAGRADLDVEAIYRRKQEIARESPVAASGIACNLEWFALLRERGIPVAIATGSSRPSILPIMAMFGLQPDAVASAEDVQRGKPHPDLFLCAAQKLGLSPGQCIVIEDSDVGIEAARNAGMKALRFYNNE